jgi:hypothetical protein
MTGSSYVTRRADHATGMRARCFPRVNRKATLRRSSLLVLGTDDVDSLATGEVDDSRSPFALTVLG